MNVFRTLKNFEEDPWENTIYSRNTREELMENDEISPVEEGFMQGYETA